MKVELVCSTLDGQLKDIEAEFQDYDQLYVILKAAWSDSRTIAIRVSGAVDIVQIEEAMGMASECFWDAGVCQSPHYLLTRCTESGGRA